MRDQIDKLSWADQARRAERLLIARRVSQARE
jgi:hypothetical protein